MLNLFQTDFVAALIILAVLVVSFTLHELAHATVAVWEGDNTPELEGRLTLNPLRHIDPMGFILIIVAGFGWARPVNTRPDRYRHGRWGEVAVSLAGIAANLLVAAACLGAVALLNANRTALGGALEVTLLRAAIVSVQLNLLLAVFNALPIPPLDGSHVVGALLGGEAQVAWNRLAANAGIMLILVLVLVGPLIARVTGGWTNALLNAVMTR